MEDNQPLVQDQRVALVNPLERVHFASL
jgi:hypothetical protein